MPQPALHVMRKTSHSVCDKKNDTNISYSWHNYPIDQFPPYPDIKYLKEIEKKLSKKRPLIALEEILIFKEKLARLHKNKGFFLHVGDCSEGFRHNNMAYTAQRISLFSELHRLVKYTTQKDVITLGRMAGQFAKPRSQMIELFNNQEIPSYFGDVVNNFSHLDRLPDPKRMLVGYEVSSQTLSDAKLFTQTCSMSSDNPFILGENFFTGHEAYLLPYEQSLARRDKITDKYYASSAHFLWIGERTRTLENAHIEFAKRITNPIGVKIGPNTNIDELSRLISALNPQNEYGRLSLIIRLGAKNIDRILPSLCKINKSTPVMWICDPMHANTMKASNGYKTRSVIDICKEISSFFSILHSENIHGSGLHLEATPHQVTECIDYSLNEEDLNQSYLTTCDPRLNPSQAMQVLSFALNVMNMLQ